MSRYNGSSTKNKVEIEELKRPYCQFCRRKTSFAESPVALRTRVGARRRLSGRCFICNSKVSLFLPSDGAPTVHSVRVSEAILRDLQRASLLLGISQRAIVENILTEHLHSFIESELLEMERGGLIDSRERARRQRELREPIEEWTPGDRETDETLSLSGLLKRLFPSSSGSIREG